MSVKGNISVAAWGVFDVWNKRITKFPYNQKANADELAIILNRAAEGKKPDNSYHVRFVKEPLLDLDCQLTIVLSGERKIRGITEVDGESRMWSKTFIDVTVISLVEDKYVLEQTFTAHRHRGELRVVGFESVDAFESFVKRRWPLGWERVMLEII